MTAIKPFREMVSNALDSTPGVLNVIQIVANLDATNSTVFEDKVLKTKKWFVGRITNKKIYEQFKFQKMGHIWLSNQLYENHRLWVLIGSHCYLIYKQLSSFEN